MMERMYRARIVSTIYWKDKTLSPGTEIEVTSKELNYLGPCVVSIAPVRDEKVEQATAIPPENTMRQRVRR
jgi:hypothetical protein